MGIMVSILKVVVVGAGFSPRGGWAANAVVEAVVVGAGFSPRGGLLAIAAMATM
jgi:hypothetical protein